MDKNNSYNNRLIISVYLLFITLISLLIVMTADGSESKLTSGDIDNLIKAKWNENGLNPSEKQVTQNF